MRFTSIIAAGFLAAGASAAPASKSTSSSVKAAMLTGPPYNLPGVGTFSSRMTWDFTQLTEIPNTLWVSKYKDGPRDFRRENVYVSGGYLNIKVPGGQKSKPYTAGEVVTVITNIKYASVRVVAILSEPAGVCNGMFFYKSDQQETDIEWLSAASSDSNAGNRKIWIENQATTVGGQKSYRGVSPPALATSTEHEYRIDWLKGVVNFYIDGNQVGSLNQNVPSVPGPWVFNNWADNDKGWTNGPPATDAIFKIKSIDMYYNTAAS